MQQFALDKCALKNIIYCGRALIFCVLEYLADYDPVNPTYNHFTQVVWKSTTDLGTSRLPGPLETNARVLRVRLLPLQQHLRGSDGVVLRLSVQPRRERRRPGPVSPLAPTLFASRSHDTSQR